MAKITPTITPPDTIPVTVTFDGEIVNVDIPDSINVQVSANDIPFDIPVIPLTTAENDFQVGSSTIGTWIKKTLAEVKVILGLGSAAYKDIPAIGDASVTEVVYGTDTRLTDSRNPLSHATSHTNGTDDIQDATTSQKGLVTSAQITKLDGIESGAEVNVNADWNSVSGDSQILNKPTIPTSVLTTRGDLIYRDAAVPARLAIGTLNSFLQSDGTNPVWSTGLLNITTAKTLTVTNSITLAGTDATVMTFPATSQTIAGLAVSGQTFTTAQKINVNSTTALLVEQDGVKDNTFVVDTTNERVGIGIAPLYPLHISNATNSFVQIESSGAGINYAGILTKNNAAVFGEFLTYGSGFTISSYGQASLANWTVSSNSGASSKGFLIGTFQANPIVFSTSNAETARFTATGTFQLTSANDVIKQIVKSAATQTTNLTEWQNSSGTALAGIEGRGTFYSNLGTSATNFFIGQSAGNTTASAVNNTGVGSSALSSLTTGNDNLALGLNAGKRITGGQSNVAIGILSLSSLIGGGGGGENNLAIGSASMLANTNGTGNVAIGSNALRAGTGGNSNTMIGYQSGYNQAGSNSIFIGAHAGYNQTASANVFLVNGSASPFASAAVELTNSILYGVMATTPANQTLTVNAGLTVNGLGYIIGNADVLQFKVKANATQSASSRMMSIQNSSSVEQVYISGDYVMGTKGVRQAVRTVTASTTMTVNDEVIEFNSASAISQTLIVATGTGARYSLVNRGAGRVTFIRAASDLIAGETSQYIDRYEGITIHDVASGIWQVN